MKRFGFVMCLMLCHHPLVHSDNTRMMTTPAIGKNHIAFIYAEDLWIARTDGTNPRCLISSNGIETNPVFSPDGNWIAFSAQYDDANLDVYVVGVDGGAPKRLTYHPDDDLVRGFTPDGKILFSSPRSASNWRHTHFYTISRQGGYPEKIPLPSAYKGSFSPNGRKIAYTPLREAHLQWKNYRGGTHSRIWIYDFDLKNTSMIPQPATRCNDTDPMWVGDMIYFSSDREGEFNLFMYDPQKMSITKVSHHDDFPVLNASYGTGRIIYEHAGYLHVLVTNTGKTHVLPIQLGAENQETRSRFTSKEQYIRNLSPSPTGARILVEYRGEILSVPAEQGVVHNLSRTPDAHERYPVWSPNGRFIAYFSDYHGEYELFVKDSKGSIKPKRYALGGAGFYREPVWSPDSKKISFIDNAESLFWIDLESKKVFKISQEVEYSPLRSMTHHWSPDSKWITFTLKNHGLFNTIYLYAIESRQIHRITDSFSDATEPIFDPSGSYLYFFASTDAGPVATWFAMSNADMRRTSHIYALVLKKGNPPPLPEKNDEEKSIEPNDSEKSQKPIKPCEIDLVDLQKRIVALPIAGGVYRNLQIDPVGDLYYLNADQDPKDDTSRPKSTLLKFSLKTRKTEVLAENIDDYTLSYDGKKILIQTDKSIRLAKTSKKIDPDKDRVDLSHLRIKTYPQKEWRQIFNEAWRINRDYFYAPNYHGVDWNRMKKKYEIFLPHLSCRSDLNRLIQWMCSELSVGHHVGGGGDTLERPEKTGGGLLGADFIIHKNRYRFAKVFGELTWNPGISTPLSVPGIDARAGEYLLAVNGFELTGKENLHAYLENTAGKLIELTIGPKPSFKSSRIVRVKPVSSEEDIRHLDWIENNIKRVDEATAGKVAYVYVPNTTVKGHQFFKRYFYPQTHKQGVIIDERFNRGGQVADYYIDILRRPFVSYWAMRYGDDLRTPKGAIFGPKVLITDETAGSGGDLFPWMFRKFGLGKLIGRPTWGGLVGVLGFPNLMDGGFITAPNLAIWNENGWIVENRGIEPDIEVEQLPEMCLEGKDPQLEKAIEVVLKDLQKNPIHPPKRPPYPVRTKILSKN